MRRLLIYAIGYALFAGIAAASLIADHRSHEGGSTAPVVTAIK